jgi:hypothetical protein
MMVGELWSLFSPVDDKITTAGPDIKKVPDFSAIFSDGLKNILYTIAV